MSDENLPGKNFSARDLRDALSKFATGVTIVTALDEKAQPIGMTASSFNSVSMEPPLVLWSVTKSALSAQAFKEADFFGIHILDASQTDISNNFATKGADKFGSISYNVTTNGIPQIAGVLTRFDCKTWAVYEGGDHWIIVGEVLDVFSTTGEGLVFSQGSYATATPMRISGQTRAQSESDGLEDPLEDLLLYQLARAHRGLADKFHSAVRSSGLSVPEWRILANLTNGNTRNLDELSRRTFVDKIPLQDSLLKLEEAGLCTVKGAGPKMVATGTEAGEKRVRHLFELGVAQERDALTGETETDASDLMRHLKTIVENTRR